MTTGFLVGSTCLENASLAADSYFSSQPVVTFLSANKVLTQNSYINPSSGVWDLQQVQFSNSGFMSVNYTVAASSPIFPACYAPSEAFADGVNIGWAFAAVLVIVVFVSAVRGVLHG